MACRYVQGRTYSPVSASRYCGWCMCHISTTGKAPGWVMRTLSWAGCLQATQHVCGHEHDAFLGKVETPRILRGIETDLHAIGNHASFIENGVANLTARADMHHGQDYRPLDRGALLDAHVREQQGLAHDRARDDAAARDHRIDGDAAPRILVQDELRGGLVFLIGPDRPLLVVNIELGA